MVGRTRRTGRIVGVVRHRAKIDRPRERVFDYIDGYQNVPEYLLGVTRFEPTTEKTSGLGAKFAVSMDVGPKTLKSVASGAISIGWSLFRNVMPYFATMAGATVLTRN